jgi:hypothetical protein
MMSPSVLYQDPELLEVGRAQWEVDQGEGVEEGKRRRAQQVSQIVADML